MATNLPSSVHDSLNGTLPSTAADSKKIIDISGGLGAIGQDANPGHNSWPAWEVAVLQDMGAPISKGNIEFLALWQEYEHSNAFNNPLNLTAPKGYAAINQNGVQSYGTRQEAAQFTANNIMQYPTLYKMLKTNNVYGVLNSRPSLTKGQLSPDAHLISDLQKWGSGTFASFLNTGAAPGDTAVKTAQSVGSGIAGAIEAPFKWLGGNWQRIFFVLGGVILVIIALLLVANSVKNSGRGE